MTELGIRVGLRTWLEGLGTLLCRLADVLRLPGDGDICAAVAAEAWLAINPEEKGTMLERSLLMLLGRLGSRHVQIHGLLHLMSE